MNWESESITFATGPAALGGSDDLEAVIIRFIDEAQSSLLIAVQELDSYKIAEAIMRARLKGRLVKIILEGSYFINELKNAAEAPWLQVGKKEPNRMILSALMRAAVDVKLDYNPKIFHQKFIVRDSKELLTGSTNFTWTGTHINLNHIAIFKNKKIASFYKKEFEELQDGMFGDHMPHTPQIPLQTKVDKLAVECLFAPDHNPEGRIVELINQAANTIEFAMFTFSITHTLIDEALNKAAERGVFILGAIDGQFGNRDYAPTKKLVALGADIKIVHENKTKKLGKLHHKLMVIDSKIVIGGSFNYTGPANTKNDENIFILGKQNESNGEAKVKQKEAALFAQAEIKRIHQTFGKPPKLD